MAARRPFSLLLAMALAAVPLTAGAHEYDGQTAGTMAYDSAEDRFYGRVGSVEDECRSKRLVKVQQQDGDAWETVGKDRSSRAGRWEVAMADAEGTFRLVVRARTKVTIEHDHRCDRFASQPQEIGK